MEMILFFETQQAMNKSTGNLLHIDVYGCLQKVYGMHFFQK